MLGRDTPDFAASVATDNRAFFRILLSCSARISRPFFIRCLVLADNLNCKDLRRSQKNILERYYMTDVLCYRHGAPDSIDKECDRQKHQALARRKRTARGGSSLEGWYHARLLVRVGDGPRERDNRYARADRVGAGYDRA